MALEFLKTILGDAYTDDIDKQISAEVGKSFVARADFNSINEEKKALDMQLATANETLESFKSKDLDIETIRNQIADYKSKAEKAQEEAAMQLEDYKFNTWFNENVTKYKGRNEAVVRTLAGEERLKTLQKSNNREEDIKALFGELQKQSAYAFETETPPPPPYAGSAGSVSLLPPDKGQGFDFDFTPIRNSETNNK